MEQYLNRLADVVHRQPDALAVTDARRQISFKDLDRISDRLARALHERRQTPNDVYGYLGSPGVERIVALIAMIKAGAAIINLDPESPASVVQDLMATCDVARLVVEPKYDALARSLCPSEPFVIHEALFDEGDASPFRARDCEPEALAAVLYTSGSTGRPKCVPLTRRGLDKRLTRKFEVLYPRREGSQRSNLVTHFRLFPELYILQNGETAECFDLRRHGVLAFADWLRDRRITIYSSQVSVFRQLMAATTAPFPDIQMVVLVGEQVVRTDVEDFEAYFPPGSELAVRFGSTEHCDIAIYRHRNGDPIPGAILPIGRPAFPETIRLIDDGGRDVAMGEPGEILVTGDFMANRYIKDPERSAETFAPAPGAAGQWECRTGFYAYQDLQGILQPVGRKDEQIKIRGYNVRPADVEQMIQEHPGVRRAAVAPFEGPKNIRRLACYFVPALQPPPSAGDLRAFMTGRAPNYMIPSVFHAIAEMPVSVTGKIQKQALPDPLGFGCVEASPNAGAQTQTERALAQIWLEILGFRDFGATDDFFDVGGDSLQAMAMLMEIERAFGVRTPLESLILDGATVRILAKRIDSLAADAGVGRGEDSRPVVLKRGGDLPPIYALPVMGGHLSDYLQLLHSLDGRQPVFGVHPRGMDCRSAPDATMAALSAHAAATIRRQDPSGPYTLMGYSYGTVVAFETARRLSELGGEVAALILLDPIAPWKDALRDLRAIYRPLKQGDALAATRRAFETVEVALGLEGRSPTAIDDAHRIAMRRYRPEPLALPRVLVVSAAENPAAWTARREWRRLIGAGMEVMEHPGEHFTMVRAPHVWALTSRLEAWLGAALRPM